MKINRRALRIVVACSVTLVVGVPAAWAAKAYTWIGSDGGSWSDASNWDAGSGQSTGYPGDTDLAEFKAFSGRVTGASGAQVLDIGPGSDLTLDGSGSFSMITVGQLLDGTAGDASLTIASGNVVDATLIELGSPLGGAGSLVAQGPGATFSTTGGITTDQTGTTCNIIATGGGRIWDGASLSMPAGGLIQVDEASEVFIGGADGGGNVGTLTIADGSFVYAEGTIAGNVVVNGTLETFNAGWPANKLTVTGNVTGTGAVYAVQELDIGGAIGSQVTVSLFGNGGSNFGLLRLAQPTLDEGTFDTMSDTSAVALTGLSFDAVSWSDADGLTLTGASETLVLATSGDHSHQVFCLQPDPLSGTDLLVNPVVTPEMTCGANRVDSYDASSTQLTIPVLAIGRDTYSDVVVTVGTIVSAPSGSSPNGSEDSYDPATGQLTVQSVTVGANTYYNVVVTLSALDSIGSVSGADTYDPATNRLTIPAVQVVGGSLYRNVVARVGSIKSVGGGMPAAGNDQYTPAGRQLFIPVVQAFGRFYTNVLITVDSVVSVGP